MDEQIGTGNHRESQSAAPRRSASYELFILVLTAFSLAAVAGLAVGPSAPVVLAVLLRVDLLVCAVFLIDFVLSLWRAPDKMAYLLRQAGWLDLLGATPALPGVPWTALLRLARLNRLVRAVRHLRGQDRGQVIADARRTPARTVLLTTIFVAVVLIGAASLLILWVESRSPDAQITTAADAFWWAFVTVTTVGYGDYVPVTYLGRLLAMVLMTFGIGGFAVLTSFMASRLVAQDDQEDIAAVVREENAAIRAELAELRELIEQHGSQGDDERC